MTHSDGMDVCKHSAHRTSSSAKVGESSVSNHEGQGYYNHASNASCDSFSDDQPASIVFHSH